MALGFDFGFENGRVNNLLRMRGATKRDGFSRDHKYCDFNHRNSVRQARLTRTRISSGCLANSHIKTGIVIARSGVVDAHHYLVDRQST
jgi:hypothetical protein